MDRIMNLFSNPIVLCGSIAFGIVSVLVIVVVICCKKSMANEREELKALSEEIEADLNEEIVESVEDQKIENVLSKMQEALELKEEKPVTFEQEQEENAIISYQELLSSLGAKSSIDIDAIEVYDDELDSHIEISDFNKEIIDAYQNENLDREIYRFQNDYSSEGLATEVLDETPVMNFDFSAENIEFIEEPVEAIEDVEEILVQDETEVYQAKHVVSNMPKKFKRTEVISPVYGIIDEKQVVPKPEEVEEIIFEDFEDNSF